MITELLAIICFIGVFVIGFAWYILGRTICLLILNDFIWKDFVNDWKNFEGEETIETILYFLFPFTILYLWVSRIIKF